MLKNKTIHKDYNQVINTNNQLSIKILEEIIPNNDSVRILSQIMEELNYEKLMKAYSPKGRNPVVSPKVLFKILVYAYMNNIYSSRKIEMVCGRDINFMWLLQGEKVPDHNTISRFRSKRISVAGEDLFYQLIKKLLKLKEIKFENIFIDGTKIEANANKYTFVWKKSTDKSEVKLQEKLRMLIRTLNDELNINYTIYTVQDKITVQQVSEILTTFK
jgi:transposase